MNDPADREDRDRPISIAETIDAAARRIMTGLVLGGAVIALAIYSRPGPPRYQVQTTDSGIVRIDTRSGTVLACEGQRCHTIVRRGQRLERRPDAKALPAPQPQQALPRPATEPAPTPAQP